MRDFTDDLADAAPPRRRGADAYLQHRRRPRADRRARGRGRASPTCGTTRTGARKVTTRARAASATTSSWSTRLDAHASTTSRRCTSSAARRATTSQEPEIDAGDRRARRASSTSSSCARCSPASTTSATRSAGQRRGRRRRRAGLDRDAAAHVPALGGAARLRRRGRRGLAGHRGRASARRRSRSRAATPTGCCTASAACTGSCASARSTPTRAARPRSRRSRCARRSTTTEAPEIDDDRPAHRHLPVVGRRRSARQRDRLGGAHHPPADRRRRVVPERALPDAEQGAGDADPRGAARRARSARSATAELEALSGEKREVGFGSQIRTLRAAAVPAGQGPAHRVRDRQRAGGARRRPRRVHRGLPAVATAARRVATRRGRHANSRT